jgi:hypothetical protein
MTWITSEKSCARFASFHHISAFKNRLYGWFFSFWASVYTLGTFSNTVEAQMFGLCTFPQGKSYVLFFDKEWCGQWPSRFSYICIGGTSLIIKRILVFEKLVCMWPVNYHVLKLVMATWPFLPWESANSHAAIFHALSFELSITAHWWWM